MAGFDHGEDRLHEAAALGALCAERQFPPDHRGTQGALADVVGRLDPFDVQERPQPIAMIVQSGAHSHKLRVAAEHPAQQQAVDLLADRLHQTLEPAAGERPVAAAPQWRNSFCVGHQVASQAFRLVIRMVDQGRKSRFRWAQHHCGRQFQYIFARSQLTTPSKAVSSPEARGGPRGPQGEDGKGGGRTSTAKLLEGLLRGRFVDAQHRSLGNGRPLRTPDAGQPSPRFAA